MLSRKDIEKEFGKELCFFPLIIENLKENSINMTISEYAWTQGQATVYWYGSDKFSLLKDNKHVKATNRFKAGQRAIFTDFHRKKKFLILLPHKTTLVETKEVIALGNKIGGAVHSKVGIVAQGIGDSGTMLGPGYCGHLMVSLHNITDDVIALEVGSTFISLTFDYLNTGVKRTSSTVSSHYDRLLEHNCELSVEDKKYFSEDWKSDFISIRDKMLESESYKNYKKSSKNNWKKEVKEYFTRRNCIAALLVLVILVGLYIGAVVLDKNLESPVWVERFWNVGCSGLLGSFLIAIWHFLKDKK